MTAIRFPGETAAYRAARDALLAAELDLERRVHEVAEMRRRLPLGAAVAEPYPFTAEDGSTARLADLFGDKDTLLVYSFMFSPEMAAPCPMCTAFLDGLEGQAHHLGQRLALAVVAASPIERVSAFARGRGWKRLRILSAAGTTYQRDWGGESPDGDAQPMMNVFVRRAGAVHHFWGTDALYADREGEPCHLDLMWPLWNVLDVTPEGRGADWYPSLSYS